MLRASTAGVHMATPICVSCYCYNSRYAIMFYLGCPSFPGRCSNCTWCNWWFPLAPGWHSSVGQALYRSKISWIANMG